MCDDPSASDAENASGSPAHPYLSPAHIAQVLSDFQRWLAELAEPLEPVDPPEESVDLQTLLEHFTALRHEVNLQTKAARSALELNSQTLQQLTQALEDRSRSVPDSSLKPFLKGVMDAYDALALALEQMTRQHERLAPLLQEWQAPQNLPPPPRLSGIEPPPAVAPSPGFWARWFGRTTVVSSVSAMRTSLAAQQLVDSWYHELHQTVQRRNESTAAMAQQVSAAVASLIAGYQMSLARLDRLLQQAGLEAMSTVGQPFDPETMEVVEVVTDAGLPAGSVVGEIRRGYRHGESVVRYAQVRVAR